MFRLGKWFGVAGAVISLTVLLTGCGTGSVIAGAGSDTIFGVMGALTNSYNSSSTNGGDHAYNIPPRFTGGGSYTVPAGGSCGSKTYDSSNQIDGSGAGINALVADSQGCIDFARSSRGKSASDPSNLEFYAFGRDAVTWGRYGDACSPSDGGPSGCAPTNLSQAQLQGIYLCTQPGGLPKYTNWSQVGGDNHAIRRYLPQTGSGTLSFFETRILGLSSAQQGVVDDSGCSSRPPRVQENDGTQIGGGFRSYAIVPYSFAQWTAQKNGVIPDVRGGVLLGSINGVAPSTGTIGANTFLGTRYVYNVTKTSSPSYDRAMNFVGVRPSASGGNGFICADSASVQSTISRYGFVPLSLASAGAGLPTSRCRKNPAPL